VNHDKELPATAVSVKGSEKYFVAYRIEGRIKSKINGAVTLPLSFGDTIIFHVLTIEASIVGPLLKSY